MPESLAFLTGLQDRYVIERELGRGGFAVVYLARDVRHDRRVALKLLHEEIGHSLGRDRFEREIKLAARLQHPHILGVFDSGELDGRLWFTMPFIEGESLRARLTRERQMGVAEAVGLVREVADALDYAHRQGVVHRDIKPENILLTERHAMVADFGIARALSTTGEQSLTQTGISVGTPGYMSPEQAMGSTVDVRTDIYALGSVLYEILAGEPAFSGPTAQAVIARLLTEEPRALATIRPGLPPGLEPVIRKAMAKVGADRHATAAEFAHALEQAMQPASGVYAAPQAGAATTSDAGGAAGRAASSAHKAAATASAAVRATSSAGISRALWVGIGLLIGGGALFAWRRVSTPIDATPALVVLPFETVGTGDDATFADGITEEVRGKLTGVPGLRVIARASSNQYKGTAKAPSVISDELGVTYLLTGTVQWANAADGTRRVRVKPVLLRRDGTQQWSSNFDDELKDVFKVQSDIATDVAKQLNVALGDAARQQLAANATDDVPAYKEFLLGEAATEHMGKNDRLAFKSGLEHYERAIAFDSGYADAWARAASIHLTNVGTTYSADELDRAREGLARAERLAPKGVLTVLARAKWASVVDKDFVRQAAILDTLAKAAPGNVDVLMTLAGANVTISHWDAGLAHGRRAAELDPRNPTALARYARVLHGTRRYALADSILAQVLTLSPGNIPATHSRVTNLMSTGDTATAARVIREALAKADTNDLIAYFALYQEMTWTLPRALQQRTTTLTLANFFNNRQQWALKVGRTWMLLGDSAKGRAYGDSAVQMARAQLAANPNDAQIYELLGRSLALAGQKVEAAEWALKSLKIRETDADATQSNYIRYQIARVLVQAGEHEKALDLLEPLMTGFYSEITPAWLRLEPVFRPLKGNPRYEKLIASR
jgi:serine/threonine-protein kinase